MKLCLKLLLFLAYFSFELSSGLLYASIPLEKKKRPRATHASRDTPAPPAKIPALYSSLEEGIRAAPAPKPSAPTGHFLITDMRDKVLFEKVIPAPFSFICESILGTGTYGTVYNCRIPNTSDKMFALKEMDLIRENLELVQENIAELRILDLLKQNSHPNVLHAHPDLPAFFHEGKIYMPLPLAQSTLHHHISRHSRRDQFTLPVVFNFSDQIIDAVEFLHSQGLVHQDLKPSNILTFRPLSGERRLPSLEQTVLRIGDFGLADFAPPGIYPTETPPEPLLGRIIGQKIRRGVATRGYRPPEIFKASGPIDPRAIDWYSVGSIMAEEVLRRFLIILPPTPEALKAPEAKEALEIWKQDQEAKRLSQLMGKRVDGHEAPPSPVEDLPHPHHQNLSPLLDSVGAVVQTGMGRTLEAKAYEPYRNPIWQLQFSLFIGIVEQLTQWDPKARANPEVLTESIIGMISRIEEAEIEEGEKDPLSESGEFSTPAPNESYINELKEFAQLIRQRLDRALKLSLSLHLKIYGFFKLFDDDGVFEDWMDKEFFPDSHKTAMKILIEYLKQYLAIKDAQAAAAGADLPALAAPAAPAAAEDCARATPLFDVTALEGAFVPSLLSQAQKASYKQYANKLARIADQLHYPPIVFHHGVHLLRQIFKDPTQTLIPHPDLESDQGKEHLYKFTNTLLEVVSASTKEARPRAGYWLHFLAKAKDPEESKALKLALITEKNHLVQALLKYPLMDSEKMASRQIAREYQALEALRASKGDSPEVPGLLKELRVQETFLLLDSIFNGDVVDESSRKADSKTLAQFTAAAVKYAKPSNKGKHPRPSLATLTPRQKMQWVQFMNLLGDEDKLSQFPLRHLIDFPPIKRIQAAFAVEDWDDAAVPFYE